MREVFEFFDTVIVPMHRKYKIDPKLTDYFLTELTEAAINIILNKSYLEAPRGLSIESAISIIDEELPKLLSKSGAQEDVVKRVKDVWDLIKGLVIRQQHGGQ